MYYVLMHKNEPVVLVDIDAGNALTDVSKDVLNPGLIPLRYQARPNGLSMWWRERAVPMSRHRIREFLLEQGYANPDQYLVANLGLSLSDTYWIKPIDSSLTWDKVNLYENSFRMDYFSFPEQDGDQTIPHYSANSSLQGDIEKSWAIIDGVRTLIKGNSNRFSSESINEVIATEMYRLQRYDNFTPYRLVTIYDTDYKYGCACKNFTSPQLELVTAYDLMTSQNKAYQTAPIQHLLDTASEHGLDREQFQYDLDMQLLGDFVLSGDDRHMNNIGFLRDTETMQLVRMAPIYDSGYSLFARTALPSRKEDLFKIKLNSFAKSERKQLSYVQDKSVLDITKLPSPEWVRGLYEKDPAQTESQINCIVFGYEKKIEMLRDIQLGRDPYKEFFAFSAKDGAKQGETFEIQRKTVDELLQEAYERIEVKPGQSTPPPRARDDHDGR